MRFLLAISAFLLMPRAMACVCCFGEEDVIMWTEMYRVEVERDAEAGFQDENIRMWKMETSDEFADSLVHELVYKYSANQVRQLCAGEKPVWANEYARYLQDFEQTDHLDFLLVAKRCEEARHERDIDPWYYHVKGDAVDVELNAVVDLCREKYGVSGGMMSQRYLLQEIRALISLGRYDECVRRWHEMKPCVESKRFYREIESLVARAMWRSGLTDDACEVYSRYGDIGSLIRLGIPEDELLEYIINVNPSSSAVVDVLQQALTDCGVGYTANWESFCGESGEWAHTEESLQKLTVDRKRLLSLAERVINERKVKDVAVWYYAAAAMSDALGAYDVAMRYITSGEALCGDVRLRKCMAVLRMYIDAKMSTYNDVYEKRLFSDLKWLDAEIKGNLDANAIASIRETVYRVGFLYSHSGNSYYWNDAMRRILFKHVIPKAQRAGRHERALQLANYASYRLINLLGDGARRDNCGWNYEDFSNMSFNLADSTDVEPMERFVNRLVNPRDEMDAFLSVRGNTDIDYWREFLGTKFIREQKYGKAVEYLEQVPSSYQYTLNVYREGNCMRRDPFEPDFLEYGNHVSDDTDYKLRFAREMHSLEKTFNGDADPNRRASAMIRYAMGLRNSVNLCWALIYYYNGDLYTHSGVYRSTMERSAKLIEQGLKKFTDDEMAARHRYRLRDYKYVIDNLADTETAQYIVFHCDNWRDYACRIGSPLVKN